MAFSHIQSSAQLWAGDAGFYQCHSYMDAKQLLTVTCIHQQGGGRSPKAATESVNRGIIKMNLPLPQQMLKGGDFGNVGVIGRPTPETRAA